MSESTDVAIVGAGFGGLGMAIRLKQDGMEDFVVLERSSDVGGTWLTNTYPGCQCDVPSNLYSFSFARKPDWTHSFPEQPQILEYLRDCARRFGVYEHCRFGCELVDARWDEDAKRWHIATSDGELSARVLVAAPGLLSEPAVPALPGIERFGGTVFHSNRWDHGHDLTGERVAVIGTGATAVQIVPRIQPLVGRLQVFQRTAPWVLPHSDRPIGETLKRLYRRVPRLQRLARRGVYVMRETYVIAMAKRPGALRLFELNARLHLLRQVRDRGLRRRLKPGYQIGCKRILLSNDWYPALTAPNTELVTDPIREVTAQGIVTADGTERELDSIVLATGFSPTDPPIARRLRGLGGRTLAEVWDGSPSAYLGTAIAGFPNLFLLYGPNSNLGHSSIVYMLEAQIQYVRRALDLMRRDGVAALEVREDVQKAYSAEMQRDLARTVWNTGGCGSWYFDRNGLNSIMWPDFTFRFRRRTREIDPGDFRLDRAAA